MNDYDGYTGEEFSDAEFDEIFNADGQPAIPPEERSGISAWKLLTGANIREPEDLPPMIKILGDVLPDQGVVVFHGRPGSMKSMLLMDAVLCLVSGSPWLPPMFNSTPIRHSLPAAKTRCFWLDMDQGRQTTEARFAALRRSHAEFDPNDLLWLSMPNPKFSADTPGHVAEIVTILNEYKVKVLIIDNLSNIRGKESLNDDGMSRVLENVRYVADAAQCLVIIIHHDAKHTGDFFGSVFIDANLDYRYHVERYDDSDVIKITTTKSRHSKPAGTIIATFDYDHINKHGQLSKARMYASQAPQDEEMQSDLIATLETMRELGNLPASKNEIYTAHRKYGTGGKKGDIMASLGDMVVSGILQPGENRKNGHPLFYLTGSPTGSRR
jgi:hypothetical protein